MRGAEVTRAHVRLEDLRRGARVFVPRLCAEAEVLEVASGGQVRVAMGPMKLTVTVEELRASGEAATPPPARRERAGGTRREAVYDGNATTLAPSRPADNTCDLRGLRADDAVAMATAFLDRS